MNDYELLYMCHQHDDVAIELMVQNSKRLIWGVIHRLYDELSPQRANKQDLYQEGCMGLLEAIDCYRDDYRVPFLPFAKLCIEREIRTLLRRYRGMSYGLIDHSLSMEMAISEDENLFLFDVIADDSAQAKPAMMAVHDEVLALMSTPCFFNELDCKVFELREQGYTYMEIAELLDCKVKSVDNSVQKVHRKLTQLFD